jgi:hypothetical protein
LGDEKRCEAYEALITKSARPRACKVEITTQMKSAAGVPMRRTMICGVVTSRYSGKN